jgi:5,8-dihydroxy-2-naphthoate synthase
MSEINIAFSTCPNDTFIFYAMLHKKIDTCDLNFKSHLFDIAELNKMASIGKYDITKLSFFAYFKLMDKYDILDSGSALGYGCGPILISRSKNISLKNAKIAIPGEMTTAHLLLKIWNPDLNNIEVTGFDNIISGVASGRYDAGLIIHEGRFVYQDYNLIKIIDLGEWWEEETTLPIPLGCIAVKKDIPEYSKKEEIEMIIKKSIQYSIDNRNSSEEYIKQYVQELDSQVINNHIDLYVNDFSLSLGDRGRSAIAKLEEMTRLKGII